jgi:hypothetical protein
MVLARRTDGKALETWPLDVIEEALGEELSAVILGFAAAIPKTPPPIAPRICAPAPATAKATPASSASPLFRDNDRVPWIRIAGHWLDLGLASGSRVIITSEPRKLTHPRHPPALQLTPLRPATERRNAPRARPHIAFMCGPNTSTRSANAFTGSTNT